MHAISCTRLSRSGLEHGSDWHRTWNVSHAIPRFPPCRFFRSENPLNPCEWLIVFRINEIRRCFCSFCTQNPSWSAKCVATGMTNVMWRHGEESTNSVLWKEEQYTAERPCWECTVTEMVFWRNCFTCISIPRTSFSFDVRGGTSTPISPSEYSSVITVMSNLLASLPKRLLE